MFKIGVQTGGLERLYDLDTAYRVVRESGFDAVDANLDHLFPVPDINNRLV